MVSVGGVAVGTLAWLEDERHPARPVVEALSWVAGIGGLVIAVVALVVAVRQGSASADVAAVLALSILTGLCSVSRGRKVGRRQRRACGGFLRGRVCLLGAMLG